MGDQPKLKPQRGDLFGGQPTGMLEPPPGAVATDEHPYPYAQDEAELAGQELVNPLPASPEVLAHGQFVFENVCIACHGAQGAGDGHGDHALPQAPQPDDPEGARLARRTASSTARCAARARCPATRGRSTQRDIWSVVHYIRKLQGELPVAPPPPTAAPRRRPARRQPRQTPPRRTRPRREAAHDRTDAHAVPPVPARLHLSTLVRGLSVAAVLGGGAALAWAFAQGHAELAWSAYLIGAFFTLGLGVFGVVWMAILYLSRADWSVTMRRIPEAMTAWLLPGGVLTLLVGLGAHALYHWSHPEAVAQDALLAHKAPFLNLPLFFALIALSLASGWCSPWP